jgi:hypothetical protein
MTRIAQSYWQAELSRKAEGIIPLSLLGFHARDLFVKTKMAFKANKFGQRCTISFSPR